MSERKLAYVPRAVLIALVLALGAQIALKNRLPSPAAAASELPPAPSLVSLRLAAFGDPIPLAKVLMLTLQAFDYRADSKTPYQKLDYERLTQWLQLILWLDPNGQYPLLAASRVYADVPNEAKRRTMLDFVYRQFLVDPDRRWPWLAHAAAIAKHRLKDLPLARRYAAAIQQHAKGPHVPLWAKQMEDHGRRFSGQRQHHRSGRNPLPRPALAGNRSPHEGRSGQTPKLRLFVEIPS